MKRIFTIALALIAVMSVNAQKLSVDNINIAAGEEGKITVNLEAPELCKALQMTMVLPEGIEIALYENDDEEMVPNIKYNKDLLKSTHSIDINQTGNEIKFLVYQNASDSQFKKESGMLMDIVLKVDEGVAEGAYDVIIKDIVVNNMASEPVEGFEDTRFAVGVGVDVTTGIDSLNADDSNEPAYNLAGQKVGKNYKGIVVKNGKKTLVK